MALLVLALAPVVLAQTVAAPSAKSSQATTARPTASPGWTTLSPTQKQALKPLASHWDRLSEAQQRKWLALSANFATMTPAEQATLHSRMNQWAALSPQQRSQARLNFGETRNVPADEKKAKWEAYQALPAEEKKRLGASAPPAPAGAATAVRPVEATKLVPVPSAGTSRASAPISSGQVQRNTLLPKPAASRPRAPASPPAAAASGAS